jgi:glycosyltransferase involved in cell wall biosynthesis
MKILILTNMYPTEREPGFGIFVQEQAEDLQRLGVDVSVFSFDGRHNRWQYFLAAARTRRLVKRNHFDLVHAHYGLCGAVALAQRRLPIVTTFHGSETGYIRYQALISHVISRTTHPIFVSQHGASSLRLPNADVIPAGVNTQLFRPISRNAAVRELGWDPDARYVLFPGGRQNPRKRFDLFEKTVEHARSLRPELRNVWLEGYSRREVALAINAADVTLVTSDYEGSPVVVRESLACATPVVSVAVGDVPRVLRGLPGCAIAARDPVALGERVVDALEVGKRSELRRRAMLSSGELVARRLLAVYESVVASR